MDLLSAPVVSRGCSPPGVTVEVVEEPRIDPRFPTAAEAVGESQEKTQEIPLILRLLPVQGVGVEGLGGRGIRLPFLR